MHLQIPDDVRNKASLALKDFAGVPRGDFISHRFWRVPVDPRDAPLPNLLRFVLMDICAGVELPGGDKTAWEVGFTYTGIHCTLALQKAGPRFHIAADAISDEDAPKVAAEAVGKLGKGAAIVEKLVLRPLADEQLTKGNVTIANQLGWLRGVYTHFRDEAATTFATPANPAPTPRPWHMRAKGELKRQWTRLSGPKSPTVAVGLGDMLNRELTRRKVGACNTLAAVNAYFSALEHTLVLVLPFTDFDPSEGRLARFIGDRWSEKIKTIFDLGNDREASRHYNHLHDIAETYRNTYSHGGFDKRGAAVWAHLPGIGALPVRLSDIRDAPHFEIFPVDEEDLDTIVAGFDAVDDWLRTAKTCYGLRVAEAGMDVAYDTESRTKYAEAMASDEAFDEFLENEGRFQDALLNFEI